MSTSTFPRFDGDLVTPFMLNLATALVKNGVEVDVLAPHAPQSRTSERLIPGLRVDRFRYAWPESAEDLCYGAGALENLKQRPWSKTKLPQFLAAQAWATRNLIRKRHYDVIHAHWLLPQGATALAVASTIPVVVTAHGSDVFALRNRMAQKVKRWVVRHATRLTANSLATMAALEALGATPDRTSLVRIGASIVPAQDTPIARTADRTDRPLTILFVGRLIELKGADDALLAYSQVRRRIPGARLVIVGDGPERTRLEAISMTSGAGKDIRFAGWLGPEQVRAEMLAADVLVVPSRSGQDGGREAQGVVPLEAMLLGLPVISTTSGGLAEIVRDMETGFLVPERSPPVLAEAVSRVLEDDNLRVSIAQKAQAWARAEGTMERTAEAFISIYSEVMRSNPTEHGRTA